MSNAKAIESLPIAMPRPPGALVRGILHAGRTFMTHVLPPLIIIGVLLIIWQALGSRPGAALPPPSKVVQEPSLLTAD